MIIIIDGYNVLKMVFPSAHVTDREREKFIMLLTQYANIAHHKIIVVFDGGDHLRPEEYQRNSILIIYSGYRESADAVIKDLLEQKQKKDMLLVSTDRELNRYAEQFAVPSIDSIDFYRLINQRVYEQPVATARSADSSAHKKAEYETSAELDALMVEGSQKTFHKHEDDKPEKEATKHRTTASKTDKRLERVLKKL